MRVPVGCDQFMSISSLPSLHSVVRPNETGVGGQRPLQSCVVRHNTA